MLKSFADEVWLVDDDPLSVLGFSYPTRMAIIRLHSGELFIWSPTRLPDALKSEVDRLGPVKYLIAPNSLHHLFLPEWHTAYPDAIVFGTEALQKKRKDVHFDATLAGPAPWSHEIEHVLVEGNLITTEAVFFHKASGTVLFTDLLQQFSTRDFKGWRRFVARLDRMICDSPSVPRKFRFAFWGRRKAKRALTQILDWPIKAVIIAHGTPITSNAKAKLRNAFSWLAT